MENKIFSKKIALSLLYIFVAYSRKFMDPGITLLKKISHKMVEKHLIIVAITCQVKVKYLLTCKFECLQLSKATHKSDVMEDE